jgi:hypothetical protein
MHIKSFLLYGWYFYTSCVHFINPFLHNPQLSCSPLDSPSKSFTVSNTHFLILFHCTSTFPLSPSFSSGVSRTFCHLACNFSTSQLGFSFFGTLWISSILYCSSQPVRCSQSLDAPGSACTHLIQFLNQCFTSV